MTAAECWAFLQDPVRPGVVATTRAEGGPYAAPVWYEVDGDTIVFNTGVDTLKGRNLARDHRVVICVQDDHPPFSFVVVEGTAASSTALEEVNTRGTRSGGRYRGPDRAEEFGRRNGVPGELLVRVIP